MKTQNLKAIWNSEYKRKQLMQGSEAIVSVKKFAKFLKKELGLRGKPLPFESFSVIDLGSGEGKHSAYFAERGAKVWAIEISDVAIKRAKQNWPQLNINFINQSFTEPLPLPNSSIDIALDVTSSNSLNAKERKAYLKELKRVLKPGAFFFLRVPQIDTNAKKLMKKYPGKDPNSYILPQINLQETAFNIQTLKETYAQDFNIINIYTETHYSKFNKHSYKRNFLVAYLQKPPIQ